MSSPPTVSYDDIHSRFEEDGVRLGDLHRSLAHFTAWHRKSGLPDRDADGLETGSSRIFMSMYEAAPDGRAQRPPYVNFWHWLLRTYEHVEWNETPQGRSKLVSLKRGMYVHRAQLSEDETKAAIALMIGDIAMTEEVQRSIEEHIREDLSDLVIRHNECLQIIDRVLDRYGDDILILMKV